MHFIYIIENLINGKAYVGQTLDPDQRERKHLRIGDKGCIALFNAVRKYGRDSFCFSLLEAVPSLEQANAREAFWIAELGLVGPAGYNLRHGGSAGGRPSAETVEKVRQANLGRVQSEAEKLKRAAANRGRKNTPETIAKMRAAAVGRPSEKCSMYGKKHSVETKKKMSEAQTQTHCLRGHPLDGPQADVWVAKDGARNCRICRRFLRSGTIWNPSSL